MCIRDRASAILAGAVGQSVQLVVAILLGFVAVHHTNNNLVIGGKVRASMRLLDVYKRQIRFRVPKGQKAWIQNHAIAQGESVNAFVNRAIQEAMAVSYTHLILCKIAGTVEAVLK